MNVKVPGVVTDHKLVRTYPLLAAVSTLLGPSVEVLELVRALSVVSTPMVKIIPHKKRI